MECYRHTFDRVSLICSFSQSAINRCFSLKLIKCCGGGNLPKSGVYTAVLSLISFLDLYLQYLTAVIHLVLELHVLLTTVIYVTYHAAKMMFIDNDIFS